LVVALLKPSRIRRRLEALTWLYLFLGHNKRTLMLCFPCGAVACLSRATAGRDRASCILCYRPLDTYCQTQRMLLTLTCACSSRLVTVVLGEAYLDTYPSLQERVLICLLFIVGQLTPVLTTLMHCVCSICIPSWSEAMHPPATHALGLQPVQVVSGVANIHIDTLQSSCLVFTAAVWDH